MVLSGQVREGWGLQLQLKNCPRCGGDLVCEAEVHGSLWTWRCINCAWRGRSIQLRTGNGTPIVAYVPPPVFRGLIPRWLIRRIRLTFPELSRRRLDNSALLRVAARQWSDQPLKWLDHWGSIEDDGETIFVSEPYPLDLSSLTSLGAFCAALKLDCTVYAASYHYPTGCLRIEIREPRDSIAPAPLT